MLDLHKILLPDGDEMSQDNIDFVVDAHIKKTLEKFLFPNDKSIHSFFHPDYQKEVFTIYAQPVTFYGKNWKLVKQRAEISFSRYDLIKPEFMTLMSEVSYTNSVRFRYQIEITPEIRQKYILEKKAPQSNNAFSIKTIHKV